MAEIKLIITGGTIDKIYNEVRGEMGFQESSHLEQVLTQECRCVIPNLSYETLFLKDSTELDDKDREVLKSTCLQSLEQVLIITHGTDTMQESASFLSKCTSLSHKTIIFTGAMRPYSLGHSDAVFNLGSAIAAAPYLPPQIYVAMSGAVLPWTEVTKNREIGKFVRSHVESLS